MSLQRKVSRQKAYKEYKEKMKGVPEKYKTSFSDYWKKYTEERRWNRNV